MSLRHLVFFGVSAVGSRLLDLLSEMKVWSCLHHLNPGPSKASVNGSSEEVALTKVHLLIYNREHVTPRCLQKVTEIFELAMPFFMSC